jgi:hypothetical protein
VSALAACTHKTEWICPTCARCAHCCECTHDAEPVHINSPVGAAALYRAVKVERRKRNRPAKPDA